MNKNDILHLYNYNRWANARIFDAASKLTPEQFTEDLRSSHRSVRDTLAHILAAEWIWLERWNGTSPKALLDPAEFPTVESIRTRLNEVEDGCRKFISGLTDQSLETVVAYTNTRGEEWKYPLGHMLQHVANHSSYHRGQVTTMLRQLGAEVIPVDLLNYEDEQ
ncbi:MAG TPA: DinB family protein [Blastocatellia bacterium]|nr:DinB family protein [Blastocatellia bacterium]